MNRMHRMRGVTIMEVLVSSTILLIGLVGIVQLLLVGSVTERRGEQEGTAVYLAAEAIDEARAIPFAELSAGSFDGGTLTDSSGRTYRKTVTIATITDAGWPTFNVNVRITYDERLMPGFPESKVVTLQSLLSQPPAP
jgi:Tfp pilus assembly protein PilV